jgi:hypothetical protein
VVLRVVTLCLAVVLSEALLGDGGRLTQAHFYLSAP